MRSVLDTTIISPAIQPVPLGPWSSPVLLAWNDLARQGALPPAPSAEGQRPLWFVGANVPDLLALGPPGAAMILLGFRKGARFMGRRHIGTVVCTSEFQGSNVLNNPPLAHPIDGSIAQNADTSCLLPYNEPPVRCEFVTRGCAYIGNWDEWHRTLTHQPCAGEACHQGGEAETQGREGR